MNVQEIVNKGLGAEQIPAECGLVVLDSVGLGEALKPVAKWQRSSGFDEPMLNSVLIVPLGNKAVRLITYDMSTRVVADVPASSVRMEHPVALDIKSLVGLLSLAVAEVSLVFDGRSAAISIPGGWAYLPTYDVEPAGIMKDLVEPKTSPEGCRRVMADAILSTLFTLKKLASSAVAGELKLLFGGEEKVYACDGNVLAASSCYFVPSAVSVADAEVMVAMLSLADPMEKIALAEVNKDVYAVVTDRFSFEFPRKGVALSKKVVAQADRKAEKYFLVDSEALLRAVKAISAVKDASGKVTLSAKKKGKGFFLEAEFSDTAGNVTRMDAAGKYSGVDSEVSVETEADYLRSVLELTSSEALAKLEVSERGISAESDTVYALVISGNVK